MSLMELGQDRRQNLCPTTSLAVTRTVPVQRGNRRTHERSRVASRLSAYGRSSKPPPLVQPVLGTGKQRYAERLLQ